LENEACRTLELKEGQQQKGKKPQRLTNKRIWRNKVKSGSLKKGHPKEKKRKAQ